MMDQLRAMSIFQKVAELGSFRAAAKALKLSPSVVSHHVAQLEDQLGTALLYRSTRRMSLTDAGRELLVASQRMSQAAEEGLAAINRRVAQPVGKLSITLNTSSANWPFSMIYTNFSKAYPKIQLELNLTDRQVDIEGSRFDLAIRGKPDGLDDSAYKARRLGKVQLCAFATPAYVRMHKPLRSFEDLADWDRIQAPPIPWKVFAAFAGTDSSMREPRIAMTCDNFELGRQFVAADLGFMIEAKGLVARDIKAGRLVELLPNKPFMGFDIYAVYPANAARDSTARLFVEHMMEQDWMQDEGHFILD